MKTRICQCLFCTLIICFVMMCGIMQSRETVNKVMVLQVADEDTAFQNVLCSCVRIQGNGYYGSGTIYEITDEFIVIATNKHVVQYFGQNSYITFFDGKEANGEVLFVSEEFDLGFIAVSGKEFNEKESGRYKSVTAKTDRYNQLQKNDSIFMVNIATDVTSPQKHSGEVMDPRKYLKDYGQEMFYGDAYAKEGMSGCGIFDTYGYYVALLSGGTQYNEIAAIPLDVIEREYKKIKK